MLVRLLHVLAVLALIGSAGYAYSIKYESIFYAEKLSKLKAQIQREKDAIAASRADWQFHVRPDRLTVLAGKYLDTQPLQIGQIVRFADIPERRAKVDEIGKKLESLGLSMSTSTPSGPQGGRAGSTATP
ncbi:hypothetical protein FHS82_003433 [Pseudochelatococcus lubricantis]|uniref:Cell division protein FtsL n=1 Tax=Pseudochelatococcus lubricantis TaxID=1538102 RepID=A0ABX0V720_9HYPH|nr:hypothetical protein [Pseudochelatococcus lubricantis]NIJ59575.1 hypothetical protein [Pseudochelatococcus lubricantis]